MAKIQGKPTQCAVLFLSQITDQSTASKQQRSQRAFFHGGLRDEHLSEMSEQRRPLIRCVVHRTITHVWDGTYRRQLVRRMCN